MEAKVKTIQFHKTLAKHYQKWHDDCIISAEYCNRHGRKRDAGKYLDDATRYAKIINDNKEAIEFFRIGDNAYKIDSALPEKFRGYK